MKFDILTKRLGLRNWEERDIDPFAEMCADQEVMKYFPKVLSSRESEDLVKRFLDHYDTYKYCYFAVELLETGEFLGFTGLANQTWESEFTPCVDIGWRFKKAAWGNGYATEAAKACVEAGFAQYELETIYAFAAAGNAASENVMKKLGMQYEGTFQHPKIITDPRFPYCFAYKIQIDN